MVEVRKNREFLHGARKVTADVIFPDYCPLCGLGLSPEWVGAGVVQDELQFVFRCPRNDCAQYYVGTYDKDYKGEWALKHCRPQRSITRAFAKEIVDLSPGFVAIYNEALAAETHGLSNLVGVGMRKALEFLIKDFCISQDTAQSEAIKKKFLGDVIRENVSDPRLKASAQRAVWLGNDETHYERRWQGKDVTDLKLLIDLTLHWVESEMLASRIEAEMPAPGGKS